MENYFSFFFSLLLTFLPSAFGITFFHMSWEDSSMTRKCECFMWEPKFWCLTCVFIVDDAFNLLTMNEHTTIKFNSEWVTSISRQLNGVYTTIEWGKEKRRQKQLTLLICGLISTYDRYLRLTRVLKRQKTRIRVSQTSFVSDC